MNLKHLMQELKRRNVFKVAVVYAISGWVLIQIAATTFPVMNIPTWGTRLVIALVVIGFPLAIILAWAFELTPEGMKRTEEVPKEHSISKSTGKKLDYALIIVLALAVIVLTYKLFLEQRPVTEKSTLSQAMTTGNRAALMKSIAVLPFTNDSGDPKQRYFSDGLSENLIIALSQNPKLTVIGRNSTFQLRNTKLDSKQIGKKLHVGTLLEGSVSHDGDEVRIRAELVSTNNGHTIWSNYYDRPYKHLFDLQDDICKAVTKALKTKLLGNSQSSKEIVQTDRPPSGNLDAYKAYLEGNFYYNHITRDAWLNAIAYYRKAISIDPKYATAYAKLSYTWQFFGATYLDESERPKAYQKARGAVDTALALNPNLAEAYMAQGSLLLDLMKWQGARRAYQHAVSLAPSNPTAKALFAESSAVLGHIGEAIRYVKEAIAANPLNAKNFFDLSEYYSPIGKLNKAEKAIKRAISLEQGATYFHTQLTTVQILLGNDEAALSAARSEEDPVLRTYSLALAYTANGNKREAYQALQKMISRYANIGTYQIAVIYAYRRQPDKVFEWLNRAWEKKDPGLTKLLRDPFLLRYKNDPRFTAFCKKIGLPVPGRNDTTVTLTQGAGS